MICAGRAAPPTGGRYDRGEFRALFLQHRDPLVDAFQRYKPAADAYSPLSFFASLFD